MEFLVISEYFFLVGDPVAEVGFLRLVDLCQCHSLVLLVNAIINLSVGPVPGALAVPLSVAELFLHSLPMVIALYTQPVL